MFTENKTELSEFYTDCLVISTSVWFPSDIYPKWNHQIIYLHFFFLSSSLQDFGSLTRDQTQALAVKVPSPNHWTTGACLIAQLWPTLCDPMDCSLPGFSVHGNSPGKNTGVGCHSLLWGIFPTQGLQVDSLPWVCKELDMIGQLNNNTLFL